MRISALWVEERAFRPALQRKEMNGLQPWWNVWRIYEMGSNVSKKVILSGACVALMLSAVGLNLWYTRYRIPESVSLEVEHPSKPFVLH